MRAILSFLFACLLFAGAPASAQQANAAAAPSAGRVAAARAMLQALLLDSGTMEIGTAEAFRAVAPSVRAGIMETPLYAGLTPAHKQALDSAFDRLPTRLAAEALSVAPAILDEFAPRFAAQMSEQSLADSTTFLRTPEGRAWTIHELRRAASDSSPTVPPPAPLSDAEASAAEQFNQSPAGREFSAPEIGRLSNELGRRISSSPNVVAAFKQELCAAIEDECPAGWRS